MLLLLLPLTWTGWLAGGRFQRERERERETERQRDRDREREREREREAVSRGNKQLISRNETLLSFSPTPSGKLKLRKL